MVALIHTIVVVLGLPRTVAAIIVRMTAILEAMVANKTTFPSPPVALATAQTHLATLVSAEAATRSKTGTTQARNDALELVVQDSKQLHGYVQQLANASPDQAGIIAAAAAMTLHKSTAHSKSDLVVKQVVSGTIHLVAKGLRAAKAHDWQLSTDGGKTWTTLQSTTKSSTVVTGLQPATVVQVRHRALLKSGPTDWSPVATAVVS